MPCSSPACRSRVSPTARTRPSCSSRLDDFDKRESKELYGLNIAKQLNGAFGSIKEAQIVTFPPPPVNGLGTIGGFKLQLEDRADLGYDELYKATQAVMAKARQAPELTGVFSNYEVNVPQMLADVNRVKAKEHGVALSDVFETLQVYLASQYVNDFNRFGRTYKVIAQADYEFRAKPEDILRLKTRNAAGEMLPLGSIVQVSESYGPDRVFRYNGYLTADINGGPAPGYSTGQAKAVMERILAGEPAQRREVRVDRSHLPGNPGGQQLGVRVPAVRAAGGAGAGCAV